MRQNKHPRVCVDGIRSWLGQWGGGTALPPSGIPVSAESKVDTVTPAPRGPSRGKGPVTTTPPNGGTRRDWGLLSSGVPRLPRGSKPSLPPPRLPRPYFREKREIPLGCHRAGRGGPGPGSQWTVPLSPRAPATPTGDRRACGDGTHSLQPARGLGTQTGCFPEPLPRAGSRHTAFTRAARTPASAGICNDEKPRRRTRAAGPRSCSLVN